MPLLTVRKKLLLLGGEMTEIGTIVRVLLKVKICFSIDSFQDDRHRDYDSYGAPGGYYPPQGYPQMEPPPMMYDPGYPQPFPVNYSMPYGGQPQGGSGYPPQSSYMSSQGYPPPPTGYHPAPVNQPYIPKVYIPIRALVTEPVNHLQLNLLNQEFPALLPLSNCNSW